ncbi:MAG: hypothetical protein PWP41_1463, partial [Moorella sp. (in: firmicutes)]|nr:hypothetical protein [Moorella sp. (in: firmicutes)]
MNAIQALSQLSYSPTAMIIIPARDLFVKGHFIISHLRCKHFPLGKEEIRTRSEHLFGPKSSRCRL